MLQQIAAMIPNEAHDHALLHRAELLLAARRLTLALESFCIAEAKGADPDRCAGGRWMVYMLRGNFTAAWEQSDVIRKRGGPDRHRFWNGEEISGRRVIVRCLHGFGDTVQFIRYAALLNDRAAKVIWEVSPAMKHLAPCFDAVEHVVTWEDECREGDDWDMQIEVMELPYICRTTVAELPIASRYLALPSRTVRQAAIEMGPRTIPRIGIVWSAGSWNAARSIPVALFRPLFETGECEFWNLQGGPDREVGITLRDSAGCNDGVVSLAGVISQLDLVITVDTLAAHLAGSLGVPVWLLLQYAADWRWMEGRNDSPWYPSLRIFRQPAPGAWEAVVGTVENKLKAWLRARDRRHSA
jgi:hypothetical protein